MRDAGPPLDHFSSSNLTKKRMMINSDWKICLEQFIKGELNLPLKRLNVYEKEDKMKYIYPLKEISILKSKEFY